MKDRVEVQISFQVDGRSEEAGQERSGKFIELFIF
jgi:hypothetical protein